jgi:hypothetical protein
MCPTFADVQQSAKRLVVVSVPPCPNCRLRGGVVVPKVGVEPTRALSSPVFETDASAIPPLRHNMEGMR